MNSTTLRPTGVRRLLRNASQMGLARLITTFSRAVYVIIVARVLGAESYGSLSVALAWTLSFLPLTTLGVGAYIVAELSLDKAGARRVLAQTFSMTAVGSLSAAVGAAWIGITLETDPGTELLICIFSLALLARGIVRWTEFVFIAYERPAYTLRQEATFRMLELACVGLVLLAGAGATAVAVAGLTCWFLQSLAGLRLVRYNLVRYPLRPDFTGAGILLTSSIPLLIMQFFSEGLFQYPLVLARHLMRDTQTVGNIAVAMQALFMVSVLPWALAQVAMPALVRSQARHDGRAAAFVEVTCRMAGLATPVFAIAAVAVGPYVVPLILGEDYALAGELLWLSMLMTGPVVVFVAAGSWLLAARHYRFSAFSAGIAVLVLLVASLILIPELGPPGVFVAAAVALLVGATIRLLPLLRTAPQSFGVQTRNAFAVAAAASIAYGVWIWLDWPRLAGALVILLLLGMAAFLWCLKPIERRSILIAVTQHAAADGNRRGEP